MSSGFGPGFQNASSKIYRAEYATFTIAILAYLVWRTFYSGGVDWLQLVFWAVFPDLSSFIPIGISSRRKEWPLWGSRLYNFFHTALVWLALFAAFWIALSAPYWPLLGWLMHITTDRSFGFGLRASSKV